MELHVASNQIRKYSDNPKEIRKKMVIDSIIQATLFSNAEEKICIKLKTSNLDEYIKMLENKNWLKTTFGSKIGV